MNNFVCIIGAQRSGTTYLYQLLDEHPEVMMAKPVRPEPKFFLDQVEFNKGKDYYLERYFSSCDPSIALIGEKGTSYMERPQVAQRIKSFFPKAKILAILRNPVHRAISNYCFSKENGFETRAIKDVFLKEVEPPSVSIATSVSPFDYLLRGNYLRYLKPYWRIFKSDMKIIVLEEFASQMNAMHDIYDFLHISNTFNPKSIANPINTSLFGIWDPKELQTVQRELMNHFAPHIKHLEEFLGRRIDAWHDKI